jgi:signal transduction histidine kinase
LKPGEIFRTTTFRTSALVAAGFGASTVTLFAFIYWQTAVWETGRVEGFLLHESIAISREPAGSVIGEVTVRFARDLHRLSFAAVFDRDYHLQFGDLVTYPVGLPRDGLVHDTVAVRRGPAGIVHEDVRAVARVLPDGRVLLLGRDDQDLRKLRRVVLRALELGLLPGLALALGTGVFVSMRTLSRVRRLNQSIARIMQGHLQERLDSGGAEEAMDQLASSVNRMLDEIERLVAEVQGVGDDIAHDLRTPLTRVRARLERGRSNAATREEWQNVAGAAIGDLDQALGMMTALLRIGQIEAGARRAGFAEISLGAVLREAAEFYKPLAEARGIDLDARETPDLMVWGDRELLFEVAANLLDNALKFTPAGGSVLVRTGSAENGSVLSVRDSGTGIPEADRALVLKRFHRSDRSRHVPGSGLGLNLVAAIVRLHGFHLHMSDAGPGLAIEMRCWESGSG